MKPSAKAAQQIATKAATEIVGRFRTGLMFHKFYQVGMQKPLEGSVDGIAEIIEQALSEAVRPYEALIQAAEMAEKYLQSRGYSDIRAPILEALQNSLAALSPPKGGEKT
jgi:hypothetical protein